MTHFEFSQIPKNVSLLGTNFGRISRKFRENFKNVSLFGPTVYNVIRFQNRSIRNLLPHILYWDYPNWHVEMAFLIKAYGFSPWKNCGFPIWLELQWFLVHLLRLLIWKRILDYRLSRLVSNSKIKRIRQLIDRWMLNQILSIKLIVLKLLKGMNDHVVKISFRRSYFIRLFTPREHLQVASTPTHKSTHPHSVYDLNKGWILRNIKTFIFEPKLSFLSENRINHN